MPEPPQSGDVAPRTSSLRSRLEEVRPSLDDWNPTIEMTQPVALPARHDLEAARAEPMGGHVDGAFLFDNIPGMIWIKDVENRVLKINRWAAKAMGIAAQDIEGRSETELHPDRADQYYADDLKVIRSRKPIYGIVEKFETAGGEDLWVLTDKIPILDAAGEVKGIVVIARDISKQKEAEQKLLESQDRLELALWGAQMGSWEWVLDRDRFFLDARAASILGFESKSRELTTDQFRALVHPADVERVFRNLEGHLNNLRDFFDTECRIRHGQEPWSWIQQKGRIVERSEDGRAMRLSGTVLDVTRRKAMEEEHDALERQMQHAQKLESLGVLAGGIAHDFNNLLTGILSQTGIARVELKMQEEGVLDLTSSGVDEHFNKIESAARRMAELTRQMLAYSGRGKFEITHFDVNEVINEIVYLLKASISKNVRFQLELSEDSPCMEGDATQVHQVLLNLVTNASDAIGEDKGTITMRTGFETLDQEALEAVPWGQELVPGKYMYVEAEDDGCGMDEETQHRLFEPFFTTKFAGRGLGLAAVLGIVRSHRGLIKVKTAPGAGTVFRVYTPAAKALPARVEEKVVVRARPVADGGRFLIIDDEKVVRMVCGQAIRTLGFEYHEADDGPVGVEIFERILSEGEESLSGVFLDMTMPQMSGREVYERIHRIDSRVPVCIMSGYSEEEIAGQFDRDGSLMFLSKPFQLEDIERVISVMQEVA